MAGATTLSGGTWAVQVNGLRAERAGSRNQGGSGKGQRYSVCIGSWIRDQPTDITLPSPPTTMKLG